MPIHDWTRVDAGIFHHFHHGWIDEIARALNRGVLPSTYYALAEQIAGSMGPDVLTLCRPVSGSLAVEAASTSGGIAVATAPPKARFHARTEVDLYARKAKAVVVRHRSGHQVIAIVEIVSPGNKSSQTALKALVLKAEQALLAGIHLVIVDLFPPTPRSPGHPPSDLGRRTRGGFRTAGRQAADVRLVRGFAMHRGLPRASCRWRPASGDAPVPHARNLRASGPGCHLPLGLGGCARRLAGGARHLAACGEWSQEEPASPSLKTASEQVVQATAELPARDRGTREREAVPPDRWPIVAEKRSGVSSRPRRQISEDRESHYGSACAHAARSGGRTGGSPAEASRPSVGPDDSRRDDDSKHRKGGPCPRITHKMSCRTGSIYSI